MTGVVHLCLASPSSNRISMDMLGESYIFHMHAHFQLSCSRFFFMSHAPIPGRRQSATLDNPVPVPATPSPL